MFQPQAPSHRQRGLRQDGRWWARWVAAALVSCLVPAIARSEPSEKAEVRLTYDVDESAATCPDERALRDAVAGRLGYDPFREDARDSVRVVIHSTGAALVADVESHKGEAKPGKRKISSTSSDCAELFSAMSLAISIAIDPLAQNRAAIAPPAPPKEVTPPPSDCPPSNPIVAVESNEPTASDSDAESTSLPKFRTSLGVLTSLGAGPTAAFGVTAQVGARWSFVSLAAEGRVDVPLSFDDRVESSLMLMSAVPCGHYAWFVGCGLASLGAARSRLVDTDQSHIGFYVGIGARAAAEIPIHDVLLVRPHLDVVGNVVRTVVRLNGAEQWRSPPLHAGLGIAIVGDFL